MCENLGNSREENRKARKTAILFYIHVSRTRKYSKTSRQPCLITRDCHVGVSWSRRRRQMMHADNDYEIWGTKTIFGQQNVFPIVSLICLIIWKGSTNCMHGMQSCIRLIMNITHFWRVCAPNLVKPVSNCALK